MEQLNKQGIAGLNYSEEVLISEFAVKFGASRRYIIEYMKELENTKQLIRKMGKVYSSRFFNADESIKEEQFEQPELTPQEKSGQIEQDFKDVGI